jgi:hypothetical protein
MTPSTIDQQRTGIDGLPLTRAERTHNAEHVGLAMAQLEAARVSVRKALAELSEAGEHHAAEHAATVCDSLDDLRSSLVGDEAEDFS